MAEYWRRLAAAALLASGTIFAAAAQPVAIDRTDIVTQVQGSAVTGQRPLGLLERVKTGDVVELAAGATLVLFRAAPAQQYTLGGPGRFLVGSNGITRLDGSGSVRAERQPAAFGAVLERQAQREASTRAVLAGAVMRGTAAPDSGADVEGIAPSRPVFDWAPRPHRGPWRFRLLDEEGQVLFETTVAQAWLELPASVRLLSGRRYLRELRWEGRDGVPRLEVRPCRVLDAAGDTELTRLAPGAEAGPATRVLYALYLRGLGLHALARQVAPELGRQEM
jgi:hypothetical protein